MATHQKWFDSQPDLALENLVFIDESEI